MLTPQMFYVALFIIFVIRFASLLAFGLFSEDSEPRPLLFSAELVSSAVLALGFGLIALSWLAIN